MMVPCWCLLIIKDSKNFFHRDNLVVGEGAQNNYFCINTKHSSFSVHVFDSEIGANNEARELLSKNPTWIINVLQTSAVISAKRPEVVTQKWDEKNQLLPVK